jgi:hypothetical protein
MWNEPTPEELARLPPFYTNDDVPLAEQLIQMHFFIGGCDWYVVEYDPVECMFFGYAILNGDFECAEWGYVSFDELREIQVDLRVSINGGDRRRVKNALEVDRDLFWTVRPASEVKNICKGMGWDYKAKPTPPPAHAAIANQTPETPDHESPRP